MRHRLKGRKLNRPSNQRKALLINMASSLVRNEQMFTTLPKAKELRPYLEKLVTKARDDSLSTKRYLLSRLKNIEVVEKLVSIIAKRYISRPGGYLRITKAGFRKGDNAPVAYIEFVDRDLSAKGGVVTKKTS